MRGDGSPWFPLPRAPLHKYTIAELVILPSQEIKLSAVNQGPIESVRHGIGRRLLVAILRASDLNSTQLLTRKQQAASGQATENMET